MPPTPKPTATCPCTPLSGNTHTEPNEMGPNLVWLDLGPGLAPLSLTAGRYHTCALLGGVSPASAAVRAVKCFGCVRASYLFTLCASVRYAHLGLRCQCRCKDVRYV